MKSSEVSVKLQIIRILLMIFLSIPATSVFARELRIVFSQYTPPYVFENGTGILVDIVREALKSSGYELVPVYAPISRSFKLFADKQVDGTTLIQESSGLEANYSDNFMQYYNRGFALKERHLDIRSISDLSDKSVVAFQGATKYMGEKFGRAMSTNSRYREIAQQDAQTRMLLLGHIDVAVMDESIFRFYREKLISEGKANSAQEIDTFAIFPPTPYKAAFKDAKIRDEFNKGLAAMRQDGRYDAIYRKYAEEYFSIKK